MDFMESRTIHFTTSQKSKFEFENVENLIVELEPFVLALTREEAKQIHKTFRQSVPRIPEARKVHLLNARYVLTTNKIGVSKQAEEFLDFLEERKFLDWGTILQALFLQSEEF